MKHQTIIFTNMKLPKFLQSKYKKVKVEVTAQVHTQKIETIIVMHEGMKYVYNDSNIFGIAVYNEEREIFKIYQFKDYPREWSNALLVAQFPKTAIVYEIQRKNVTYNIVSEETKKVLR